MANGTRIPASSCILAAEAPGAESGLTVTAEDIRAQFKRIVASGTFASSARMSRFLQFSVEEMLAGRIHELKETTIGLAVFDRPPDYDPRLDPIVRVEARRLREKLSRYYETDGQSDLIVIDLPRGGYAPTLHERIKPSPAAEGENADTSADTSKDVSSTIAADATSPAVDQPKQRRNTLALTAILLALALIAVGIATITRTNAAGIRERDSLLVAEFVNRTGEVVFDHTLRQALASHLIQSPFLAVVQDERVRETLRMMERPEDDRLLHRVALEVCRRQRVKAMLTGSISSVGHTYVLTLDAINCQTGEVISSEQSQVQSRERVLPAIGKMASKVRRALGESLTSVQRFDAPIEQTTTPSLEALRAYTLGQRQRAKGNEVQAISFFQRAVELDSRFAAAYTSLSNTYSNLGEPERAKLYAKLAFEHRDGVSQRERLYITYQYHDVVTGDESAVIPTLEVWKQSFPREFQPPNGLAFHHNLLGHFERALDEAKEAISRNPQHGFPYSNLAVAYRGLGRLSEAGRTAERAVELRVDTIPIRLLLYQLAVMSGQEPEGARHLHQVGGNPRGFESFGARAQVAAWAGKVREARQLYNETARSAKRNNFPEVATGYLAHASLMELLYGNVDKARTQARRLLGTRPSYDHILPAALTLALSGSAAEVESVLDALRQEYPQHTIINSILLPTVKAAMELSRKRSERAIEHLRVVVPYETGIAALLAPIYLRGEAYLMQRSGVMAAHEFQRVLEHRGTDLFSPFHAMAQLGLARALAMAGNREGSVRAYKRFLANWSAADPDVPVLLAARQECARQEENSSAARQ
ncbi:MAG TPA: FlgO family outer membrane protein [Bryobacteraceae bacterium]|nr:FlgO family outer membrane protein [Bryobacteraceae bacterium]